MESERVLGKIDWIAGEFFFVFEAYLQMVLWERAPTPGNLRLARAFPTSACVTPNLMRRCLNLSAKASNSLGSVSASWMPTDGCGCPEWGCPWGWGREGWLAAAAIIEFIAAECVYTDDGWSWACVWAWETELDSEVIGPRLVIIVVDDMGSSMSSPSMPGWPI